MPIPSEIALLAALRILTSPNLERTMRGQRSMMGGTQAGLLVTTIAEAPHEFGSSPSIFLT